MKKRKIVQILQKKHYKLTMHRRKWGGGKEKKNNNGNCSMNTIKHSQWQLFNGDTMLHPDFWVEIQTERTNEQPEKARERLLITGSLLFDYGYKLLKVLFFRINAFFCFFLFQEKPKRKKRRKRKKKFEMEKEKSEVT